MRRLPLLLLLLTATFLGWAAFALMGTEPAQPPEEVAAAATGPEAPAPAARPLSFDATLYDDPEEGVAADDEGNQRREVVPEQPAIGPGPTLLVVQGNPPVPVAGAAVAFVGRDQGRALQRSSRAPWIHDLDLPAVHGIKARTDDTGRVPLPSITAHTIATASHQDLFGAVVLHPGQSGEVRLHLRTDETLTVIVRDGAGQPTADVPVAIFQGRTFGRARQIWLQPTGPDGIARATHFQHQRRGRDDGDQFAVALRLPLAAPVAASFQGDPAQEEPIHLTLPATGGLELTLTDHRGNPLCCEATLALGAVRPEGFRLDLPLGQNFDWLRARKTLGPVPVAFPMIGLGLEVQPAARLEHDGRWFGGAAVRGPGQPGEIVRATIALSDDFTVLAGFLRDEGGAPVDASVTFAIGVPGGRATAGSVRSLPDGTFDLPVRLPDPGAFQVLELRLGTDRGLRLDLGTLHKGERRELGELRLGELPVLAHGRTVNDLGEAVPGAAVRLQRYTKLADREGWFDATLAHTGSDAEGRFVLTGHVPPGQIRVRAQARQHFPGDSPPIAPGADLLLTLTRTGTLTGTVLLPDWLPNEAASLRLLAQDDPRRARDTGLRTGRGGAFRIGGLRPGRYDAVVTLRNLPDPVLQLYGVAIAPGDNEDPRLKVLDLRNSVFRYRLRAVGNRGEPLRNLEGPVLMRTRRPDGNIADLGFRWQRGRAELITQSPMVEVIAFAKGYPPTSLTIGPGDHDIYLQELHPAVIHLPGARALCGPGRAVRVSMIFQGDTGLPQWLNGTDQRSGEQFSFPRWELSKSGGAWLGEFDTVDVPLSRSGPHEVILRIYEDERQNGGQASVTVGVAQVVVDGPGPVSTTLALDTAKVRQAVEQLDARRAQRAEREQQRQQQRPGQRGRGGR